jgi:hypothetical protein
VQLAALGVLCVVLLAAAGSTSLRPEPVSETIWQQLDLRCEKLALEVQTPYPWPIAPFHEQHPVRGYFGDPRTVIGNGDGGAYSFHNGIDIAAWTGNHVYPVISGSVVKAGGGRVVVRTDDDRMFQYIHIVPWVHSGEQVTASRTVLGTVRRGWNHVHLTEIREDCAVNPLMPGHLEPYRDRTKPVVQEILFQDPARRPEPANALRGRVRILAAAYDTPPIPSPFPWNTLPVSPARVSWTLSTVAGRVLIDKTGADFRFGEPFRRQFCTVYAPGTEQNFAAVGGTFHWGKAGRYLYDLTPSLLGTGRLGPGRYRLTVTASDTAGNSGSRSTLIRVRAGPAPFVPVKPDLRCAGPGRQIVSRTGGSSVSSRASGPASG